MNIHFGYQDVTSIESLFQAWDEFKKGKKRKRDVQTFELNLEDNLFNLHRKLISKTYKHGDYQSFYVHDPKKRHIHKASIEDRILHHLLLAENSDGRGWNPIPERRLFCYKHALKAIEIGKKLTEKED